MMHCDQGLAEQGLEPVGFPLKLQRPVGRIVGETVAAWHDKTPQVSASKSDASHQADGSIRFRKAAMRCIVVKTIFPSSFDEIRIGEVGKMI
jgi:hypothetical protein